MKLTKTLFGIFIVAGCLLNPSVQTIASTSANNELSSKVMSATKVYLKGRLSTPTKRSASQLIEVYQEDKTLMISYFAELGGIEITISDDLDSIVYSEIVSVSERTESFIDLSRLKKGSYTLNLKNIEGEELSGTFAVE